MTSYKQYTKAMAWLLAAAVMLEAASSVPVFPVPPPITKKVKIQITNDLEGQESLQVHCKDKNTDFGVSQVAHGSTYEFEIVPNGLSDYFCGFVFKGVLHWYDIYLDSRDAGGCARITLCSWSVREAGPCLANRQCDRWNSQLRA